MHMGEARRKRRAGYVPVPHVPKIARPEAGELPVISFRHKTEWPLMHGCPDSSDLEIIDLVENYGNSMVEEGLHEEEARSYLLHGVAAAFAAITPECPDGPKTAILTYLDAFMVNGEAAPEYGQDFADAIMCLKKAVDAAD
jgi:hypothetical protein